MKKIVTFDANGKKLGRLASEIAMALQGKNEPSYERHVLENIEVRVVNASQLDLAKRMDRGYKTYSGYPGGLRIEKASRLQERKGTVALLKHAVSGMLPKNTHRSRLLACLVVEE
jgi:large subunit ribosomal protein L13